MAVEVVWLDQALEDLWAIGDRIATTAPNAAHAYVDGLLNATRQLSDFPLSGMQHNEVFRRIIYRNHLVLYNFSAALETVKIYAVVDARRDLEFGLPAV